MILFINLIFVQALTGNWDIKSQNLLGPYVLDIIGLKHFTARLTQLASCTDCDVID